MTPERLLALFERISEAPDAISRLRGLILDLAVRGKLIEHDLTGERVYLDRHARSTPEPASLPFSVPPHWSVFRLGETVSLINGRAFKPTEWSSEGLPIIRIQNLNNPRATFNRCNLSIPERFHVKPGDLLLSWSGTPGTSFGAHIWQGDSALLNQHIFRVVPTGEYFEPHFFKLAVNARLLELIDHTR